MSKFPRLNLRKLGHMKPAPVKDVKDAEIPRVKSSIRYVWFLGLIIVFSFIMVVFIPSGHVRHMKRLTCVSGLDGYKCKGYGYGEILVKSSKDCMDNMFNINGVPFHVARRGTIFRAPSSDVIRIRDAAPHCEINVFHDSDVELDVSGFYWVATSDHTEFTVYDGADLVLDRVSAEFIPHEVQGKWVGYTYPGTSVSGNGNTPIHVFRY